MCFWKIEVLIGSSSQFYTVESISTVSNDHIGPPLQPLYQGMIHLMWMSRVWQVWFYITECARDANVMGLQPTHCWRIDSIPLKTINDTMIEFIAVESDVSLIWVSYRSIFFEFRTQNSGFQMIWFSHQNRWLRVRVGHTIARYIDLDSMERSAPSNTLRRCISRGFKIWQNLNPSTREVALLSLRIAAAGGEILAL